MKRIIITGATGFVGANLARRLLQEGHEVHLLLRSGYSAWRINEIVPHVHLHLVDFLNPTEVQATFARISADWIFHLAAHGAYSWQQDVSQIMQTNFLSTVNLVEAALAVGFEAFINTGSSSEYGYKDHAPAEDEGIDPNSYYAVAKSAATMYCRHVALSKKVNLVTLRLYSVYGPYEEKGRLIPAIILNGLQGKLPPLVNPAIARDYIYTEDVNEAYLAVATAQQAPLGSIYNVGTGIQTSLKEVVDVAQSLLPIADKPQWGTMEGRSWDTDIWVADSSKLQQEMSWKPKHSFVQGLKETIDWYKNHLNFYV